MSVHSFNSATSVDQVQQAKVDLAAAHRLAVLDDLDEGIDNHFTVTVPGYEDRYLILPFGLHWSEARASDMAIFGNDGTVLEGEGSVELSAYCIHAPIHRITGTRVVLHTHQTWALALNMLDDNRLVPASQTAAYFHDRVTYDDHYAGTAEVHDEGERVAHLVGDKHVLFMKNHGVCVMGDTVPQAYRRLYKLERVCKAQILAMSTGRALAPLAEATVCQVQAPAEHDAHSPEVRERMYFDAMMRVLDRELPGYAG